MKNACRGIVGLVMLCILFPEINLAESRRITFSAKMGYYTSYIYCINENGENLINLTYEYENSSQPTWHPKGLHLMFTYENSLYMIDYKENTVRNVSVESHSPVWSPDGEYVAYVGQYRCEYDHIYITNPLTNYFKHVSPEDFGTYVQPAWHPTTGELFCVSLEECIGSIEIYTDVMTVFTGDVTLAGDGMSFSPDGSTWATSLDEGIAIVDAENFDYYIIPGTEELSVHQAAWSLDGKKIAYSLYDMESESYDIYTVDYKSHEQVRVTNMEFTDIDRIVWRPEPPVTAVTTENKPSPLTLTAAPNPFNPSTTVTYTLAEAGEVELGVYSVLGQKVADIETGYRSAGTHSIQWNASDKASGVYMIRLRAGDRVIARAVTLMK